jgi:hypothetical protein
MRSFRCPVPEAFSEYFQSISSSYSSGTFSSVNQRTEMLSLVLVSNSDVQNAIKRLRPSKSVGLDGIPCFVIKGCSEMFVPVLRFIFNLSLSQNTFPNVWKQAAIVPVFKKGKTSSVGNYRPIASQFFQSF